MSRHSCIYEGWVRHRRFAPVAHVFEYRLFMMYLDLAELPNVFDGRWLWSSERPNVAYFRRADHLGAPQHPLADCVRQLVKDQSGALSRRADPPAHPPALRRIRIQPGQLLLLLRPSR